MQSILSKEDFSLMLSRAHSVLYFYVDWSAYAIEGLHMLEEVESVLARSNSGSVASFWLADVSDVNAPAAFIGDWLKGQERAGLKLYNIVALGNGSVAWLKRGEIVNFAQCATALDVDSLSERTRSVSSERAT